MAILFVFVSVRAMLSMASGEAQDGALDSTKLSFNYNAHEVRLRGYLQALESMGLDFNR